MNHSFFRLSLPENFTCNTEERSSIRFRDLDEAFEFQPPYVTVQLFPIKEIDQQQGNIFIERFIRWSAGFKSRVQSTEEIIFKGFKTYIVHAKTDAIFQKQHLKITYFNACILLDETWCVDFQFIYETQYEKRYGSVAEAAFQSLEILGEAQDWASAYQEEVVEVEKAYQRDLEAREEERREEKWEHPPFEIPRDGREYIEIGNFDFEFIEEGCKWHTVEFSKRFYVQVRARTSHIQEAKEQGLLEYGYQLEEGEVQFSFDCGGIFKAGIPTGELRFEEGKTGAPQFLHFRCNGVPLDFYGTATMREGWIGMNGVLKKSYQEEPCFPLTLYKRLSTDGIDWPLYQFTLEEALQIQAEAVQYIGISEYHEPLFPQEILSFKNLKHLSIHRRSNTIESNEMALKEISARIGELEHLTELTLCNTSVTELPESLGELKKLERLNLANNRLKRLPKALFSLPKLKYLWASRNEIEELPEKIYLPHLEQVDLSYNQVTTLPESLARQPKLKKLSLQDNPLQSLPAAYNQIENIDMDIDDKRRLLNYDYQGADGKGTIAWEEEVYYARNDKQLHERLLKAVENPILSKYTAALEKLALKAVCLKTTEPDAYAATGNTRFGGLPDLPPGEAYPSWQYTYQDEKVDHHYIFIGQLNCEELAPYQDYLPRKGILYFFLEDEEEFGCKVMYHPNTAELQSAQHLDAEKLNIFDTAEPYTPFKVECSSFVALPSFYSDEYWYKRVDAPELANLEDYEHPDYEAFTEKLRENLRKDLGKKGRFQEWNNTYYPDSQHSINDYVFTQHESPQEQAALKYKGNPEDWVVLLKVYSDSNCGFCFWDAGELFFVIHKSDLAKGDFSKVFASIETS